MIRSATYFPLQCANNSGPVLQALLESLRGAGVTVTENNWDADVAIIWSVLWAGRMKANHAVWKHYTEQGKPVVVVDVGALYRGETWKVALNTITAEGYYGHKLNLDWDRPRKLGISLAINVSRNPRIVIAAQHAQSLQVAQLGNMESWIIQQINLLRQITDRPIVIRPHPRSKLDTSVLITHRDVAVEQPIKVANTYDSYNLAFDCHAMVNYNSGPGIQAALAGTRPIVDVSSLAHPVSINMHDIEKSYSVDRDQWLTEICHTEYTIQELRQGLWLQRLRPGLEN